MVNPSCLNAWTWTHAACDVSGAARTSNPDPALASAVRRLREERGITREALAFHSGITTGSLARIELTQSTPGWDTVRSIAKALEISLTELGTAVEGAE